MFQIKKTAMGFPADKEATTNEKDDLAPPSRFHIHHHINNQTETGMNNRTLSWGIPPIILSIYFLLSRAGDIGFQIPLVLMIAAVLTVILSLVLYFEKPLPRWSRATVLLTALVIRLFFVGSSPTLSDDMYRYVVDGRQILSGHNPYALAPSDIQTADPAVQRVLGHVNHPDLVTIYPPAAQIVFALAAVPGNVVLFKAVLVLFDLGVCALIMLILDRMKTNRDRAVLYAWHPLSVLETASSGHIDTAALFFLFLAVFFIHRTSVMRNATSGSMLALSGLVKLFPFALVPAFFLVHERNRRVIPGFSFTFTTFCLCLAFMPNLMNGIETLGLYVREWEFSGFLFRLSGLAGLPQPLIRPGLALAFVLFVMHDAVKNKRSFCSEPDHAVTRHAYITAFAYLMLTPTLHPWYALYLVAFLPFHPGVSGLCLSWAVFLTYYVLIGFKTVGVWQESGIMAFMVFATPVSAWVVRKITLSISPLSIHADH